jgi:predicted nuclease of restriction endonuclease-like (RecB) superfamily
MQKMNLRQETAYLTFLADLTDQIRVAQKRVLRLVNQELLQLYWFIGKSIVEKQKEHAWGDSVVSTLAKDLHRTFPNIAGFSPQNLWYMRQFYTTYENSPILQPLVGEISWTKHLIILSKCKTDIEREFYIRMTSEYGWTKNVLIHQVENQSFEKFLLNQSNFEKNLPPDYKHQALLALKDEYVFDFLDLTDYYSEKDLEKALLQHLQQFLTEMGPDFTFVGSQFHLYVGDQDFYIDLLLFHRRLRSLVAIDLKISEFKPEFKGKMEFYLNSLNHYIKLPDENPSIGIIICKSKNQTIVEFALQNTPYPIGVAGYTLQAHLPQNLTSFLPNEETIRQRIEAFLNAQKRKGKS